MNRQSYQLVIMTSSYSLANEIVTIITVIVRFWASVVCFTHFRFTFYTQKSDCRYAATIFEVYTKKQECCSLDISLGRDVTLFYVRSLEPLPD